MGKQIQRNLYKAEQHGTENIFHIGQISALYKIAKKKVKPIKIILPMWCIPVYKSKSAALALVSR
jgi:hypothetical protein